MEEKCRVRLHASGLHGKEQPELPNRQERYFGHSRPCARTLYCILIDVLYPQDIMHIVLKYNRSNCANKKEYLAAKKLCQGGVIVRKLILLLCILQWPGLAAAEVSKAAASYLLKQAVISYELGDYKTAARELKGLANQGSVGAQTLLGNMYYKGQGVPQDYKLALEWYLKAAEQGDTNAQYNLGLMYYNGSGVQQDLIQAYIWVNLAAISRNKDSSEAQDDLVINLTTSQLEEAQRQMQEWLVKHRRS